MEADEHILPGAFGEEAKTVPLVVYMPDGKRRVVGEATITPEPTRLSIEGYIFDREIAKQVGYATEWMDGLSLMTTPTPKFKKPKKDS